jgi:hypothetical protein
MTAYLKDFGRSRLTVFRTLLGKSNEFLASLSDPLTCDLGLHAWLRPQREESYSMWLQWSLQQLKYGDLIGALNLRANPRDDTAAIEVRREVQISYRDGSVGKRCATTHYLFGTELPGVRSIFREDAQSWLSVLGLRPPEKILKTIFM